MGNLCYVAVMRGPVWSLGIVKDGERGYYVTDYPTVRTPDEAEKWAKQLNDRMGLSEKRVAQMVGNSMRVD